MRPEASPNAEHRVIHPTEHAKAVRQRAHEHRNDGAFWNRRYAAVRS